MSSTSSVAGVVAGLNPLVYSASAPYTIFLFQAVFIIVLCQIVYYPIKRIQQPKVIAEVITGILLGPSVMGHIPNFTANCFPLESIPGITLFANIGIILFLFIIGLEVDVEFIRRNLTAAISVGLINMAIPFALGCGIAKGLYDQYHDQELAVSFTTFMVFIAVAMCITAFPVLVRILTELNLIVDRVGTVVLAAGITNDLTGWILLALAVTLANSAKGINTLYILLLTAAWFIFLLYPVRIVMRWSLKKFTNDLVSGDPSQISMMAILVCVFISAFYTDIIGVHPIFGAFMVGVIVPRDNGYVIKITEKLEDLVHIVLIPLYFALAGLNVNLGLLNEGIDWAYIVGIILLAMAGKIFGGFIAAKLNKLLWRESLAVGVLMSCKGIVEIVVLNLGLQTGIISKKIYSMFVVMALVTTFATTPLTLLVYPVSYREEVAHYLKGESSNEKESPESGLLPEDQITKLILLLKRIDTISHLMTFVHDICLNTRDPNNYEVDVQALHLREFTSRTSHLLEASTYDNSVAESPQVNQSNENEYKTSSSILSIIQIFTEFLDIHFTSKSLLSTNKNQVLTINEQISKRTNFLISSINTTQLIQDHSLDPVDSSDYHLFKELFQTCKCHFGLLLIGDKNKVNETDATGENVFGLKSVNLILNHADLISSSDMLALHLVHKLSYNLLNVNVFIRGSNNSDFARKVEETLLRNESVNLSVNFIKENVTFADHLLHWKKNLRGETFVMANNVSTTSNSKLLERELGELVNLSVEEGFNVLAVKSLTT